MIALASVCTKDRFSSARVLARSFAEHHPDAPMTLLVVDEPGGCFDPAAEPFEVIALSDLGLGAEAHHLALRYGPFALAAGLKPHLLRHQLERHERVVYMDTDIRLYAPQGPIEQALESHEIVLTPHFLDPVEMDGQTPTEPNIIRSGAFNAGVLAVRRGEHADRFLSWWAQRLRRGSKIDLSNGYFYEQHWLDLVPGMFGSVHLLGDRGTNVAYWNLAERPLATDGDVLTVAGVPLRCLHFSGFDPDQPGRLSSYGTRASASDDAVLERLCQEYAAELEAADLRGTRGWPYGWAATATGTPLTPQLRSLLDHDEAPAVSMFDEDGEREWLQWLAGPAITDGPESLTRLLSRILEVRPDLQERFPSPELDCLGLLRWVQEHGVDEFGLPDSWLARSEPQAHRGGLRDVRAAADVDARRGEVLIVIPLFGAHDLFVRCLGSVLAHSPRGIRVLIADDADPDPANRSFADELASGGTLEHEILWLRRDRNAGFVENVNDAFAVTAPADVIVLNSDCVVAGGWLEGLQAAAYDDTNVATATALTNHGTIASVPGRNAPRPDLPQGAHFPTAARGVRGLSQRLRPRVPTCIGHCFYVRRDALELVGPFDTAFTPAYGEEVDFAQRCLVQGLVHVLADDVLVLHRQGGSLNTDDAPNALQTQHDKIIAARYPYYERLTRDAAQDDNGPLARALTNARRGLGTLRVTIDGRNLGPILTGTQVHIVELIGAVARTETVDIRVIVPDAVGDYADDALQAPAVRTITQSEMGPNMERTAVMHRPYQVAHPDDLTFMAWAGERAIITQQDLIAYRNPGYFPGYPQFARYRRLTRAALSFADAVVFFSHHAARDAATEELVDPRRSRVVYIGVDHSTLRAVPQPACPSGCETLGEREILLCLGTDFRHKNRLFALRVVDALQRRHDWQGRLVLAGARILHGSSLGDEAAFLATRPRVAEAVVSLPAISEAEKAWLYTRADALLYPTLYEGFGLMPFEAAEYDTPALWAPQASLAEVLPIESAALVPWDPDACADATIEVLRDPERAASLVADVRRAAQRFRWDAAGRQLIDVYETALTSPVRAARVAATDLKDSERERNELQRKYQELLNGFTNDGRRLVGSGGLLTPQEQRVLRGALERGGSAQSGFVKALSWVDRLRPSEPTTEVSEADPQQLQLHWEWLNRRHVANEAIQVDPLVLIPEPG